MNSIYPRQMGKTSYYMALQLSAIITEFNKNPACKFIIASMNEQYGKALIKFAKLHNYKLELTIPEAKGDKMFWTRVVSIEKENE